MKVFKKNQLAILVIALMLITAGYLNYDTAYGEDKEAEQASVGIDENYQLADFGDAELVNTNTDENNVISSENLETSKTENEVSQTSSKAVTNDTEKKVSTDDNYFSESKLERNVMYSQMIERYQGIINSSNQAEGQKSIAEQEINKINYLQNAIMITENLLSTKGFTENIVFVNGESVSVIIGKDELKKDEIAQVQNIVSRELKADIENIHISLK